MPNPFSSSRVFESGWMNRQQTDRQAGKNGETNGRTSAVSPFSKVPNRPEISDGPNSRRYTRIWNTKQSKSVANCVQNKLSDKLLKRRNFSFYEIWICFFIQKSICRFRLLYYVQSWRAGLLWRLGGKRGGIGFVLSTNPISLSLRKWLALSFPLEKCHRTKKTKRRHATYI